MSRFSVEQCLPLAWGSTTVRRLAGEDAINRNNKAGSGAKNYGCWCGYTALAGRIGINFQELGTGRHGINSDLTRARSFHPLSCRVCRVAALHR